VPVAAQGYGSSPSGASASGAVASGGASWSSGSQAPTGKVSATAAKSPSSAPWRSKAPAAAVVAPQVTPPPPLFTQCPAVGLNTGCRLLIVINPDGSVVILVDPDQSTTYDGSEDTLIGVQNNSNSFVQSLDLASSSDAFGFDEDGLCDFANPNAPGCDQGTFTDDAGNPAFGQTGYEGPNTAFTNVSVDGTSGTVNFTNPPSSGGAGCGVATPQPGLAPGASAYFGLEEEISGSDLSLSTPPVVTPCPPPTTAPPPPAVAAATASPALARTGQNTAVMVRLAMMLLFSGALLIAFSRKLALRAAVHAA
jgi:hypothetical protein